jgi:tRNA(fMet)-specific endonuclease VapC
MQLLTEMMKKIGRIAKLGKFLIDTNVCIYHFEEFPDVVQFMKMTFRQPHNELVLSVITEAELLSTPSVSENATLKSKISEFVNVSHQVIDVDRSIASKAGEIRSFFQHSLGRKIKLPDALIAATAINYNATLVSNNDKDFLDIVSNFNMSYYNPVSNQNSLRDFLSKD